MESFGYAYLTQTNKPLSWLTTSSLYKLTTKRKPPLGGLLLCVYLKITLKVAESLLVDVVTELTRTLVTTHNCLGKLLTDVVIKVSLVVKAGVCGVTAAPLASWLASISILIPSAGILLFNCTLKG